MADRSAVFPAQKMSAYEFAEAISDIEVDAKKILAYLGSGGRISGGIILPTTPLATMSVVVPSFLAVSWNVGHWLLNTNVALTVNLENAGDLPYGEGGTPDGGVIELPSVGNVKWLTLAAVWTRYGTDPRPIPATGASHNYRRVESFFFRVVEGTADVPGAATKPLEEDLWDNDIGEDGIVLADILLEDDTTAITSESIDMTRSRFFSWRTPSAGESEDDLTVLPQIRGWNYDFWVGIPALPSPTNSPSGAFYFTPYPDDVSQIRIMSVTLSVKPGTTQTAVTTVEFSLAETFDTGDEFSISLATGTGDTSWRNNVLPSPAFLALCNNVTDETPVFWRFTAAGSHQSLRIGVEYARVT